MSSKANAGNPVANAGATRKSSAKGKGGRELGFEEVYEQYDATRRRSAGLLDFSSVPPSRQAITHLDLDLTLACNLRCSYCFKVKDNEHTDAQIALDAVTWLIYASGAVPEISVAMIGGEPLVKFDTIKRLVPFATRRAVQHGKRIHFSATTNGTLVNEEILGFFKQWGIGFHTSVDGHPEVQDRHRSFAGGKGSSETLGRTLPQILSVRPNTCARSTVMPDTAKELPASFEYFLQLGYRNVAFVPAAPSEWDDDSIGQMRVAFDRVGERVIELFREGTPIQLKYVHEFCQAKAENRTGRANPCGVGRGMMLADINGDLWPCHRWNKQDKSWRLGSLYSPGSNTQRREIFFDAPDQKSDYHDCATCIARPICAGGCPAENLEETGDPWKRHVNACRLEEIFATTAAHVHRVLSAENSPRFQATYPSQEERACAGQ